MTRLLVSVMSLQEARVALANGADMLDFKDPSQGALGALPLPTIKRLALFVGERAPVSATIGDLATVPGLIAPRVSETAACGVDIVKIGMFPSEHLGHTIKVLRHECARGHSLVAVLFADLGYEAGLLHSLARAGFRGAMLDTADKSRGSLRAHMNDAALGEFVRAAHENGLMCGLAGSLRMSDVAPLRSLGPDFLGFRSAACASTRTSRIVDRKVARLAAALAQRSASAHG